MSSYLSYFDESRYLPPRRLLADYRQRVAVGYARMQTQRVVIAGLARNIADILPATRARIERLAENFSDHRILIYENDSTDSTAADLSRWAEEDSRMHLLSESLGHPVNRPERCLKRAERMARYRQNCQDEILNRWSDFDQVILIDTDLVGGWSYDGIAHSYGYNTWDFVGSCGIIYKRLGLSLNHPAHYDAWAYREDANFTPLSARYINRLKFRRGDPMLPLYSCFGGLGLYNMPAYQSGRYDGDDIEHVGFHRTMRERGFGQSFMNPSQVVVYGRKHRKLDPVVHQIYSALARLKIMNRPEWMFSAFGDEPDLLTLVSNAAIANSEAQSKAQSKANADRHAA
jgi:hypothetical protein